MVLWTGGAIVLHNTKHHIHTKNKTQADYGVEGGQVREVPGLQCLVVIF